MRNWVSLSPTVMLIMFSSELFYKASCGKYQPNDRVNDNLGLEKVEYGYNGGLKSKSPRKISWSYTSTSTMYNQENSILSFLDYFHQPSRCYLL